MVSSERRARAASYARMALSSSVSLVLTLAAVEVWADVGYAIHAEGGFAHLLGGRKSDQFGWGGSAVVSPELKLTKTFGVELDLGVLGVVEGAHADPSFARSEGGSAYSMAVGLRFRPLAMQGPAWADAIWVAGGVGVADTGGLMRPIANIRVGYDFRLGPFALGPAASYFQIIDVGGQGVPADACIIAFGAHVSFGRDPAERSKELDRDHDGIPDAKDKCPNEPEDKDGFQDDDGCPDPDNDHDGIPDAADKCPNEAEDKDGFQDEDGCPDLDNDNDGIPDAVDPCPNEPETVNGFQDDDGCPDEVPAPVVAAPPPGPVEERVVLRERVKFAFHLAEVQPESMAMLAYVAKLVAHNPDYLGVRIIGYADDIGDDGYNLILSEKRARAVRAMLVRLGVEEGKLQIAFYGNKRPLKTGRSDVARSENRRVEFEVTRRRLPTDAPSTGSPGPTPGGAPQGEK